MADHHVSPYIDSYGKERKTIESLILKNKKKWTAIASKEIVNRRRNNKDILVDVRALELFQYFINQKVFAPNAELGGDAMIAFIAKDYKAKPGNEDAWLLKWKQDLTPKNTYRILMEKYFKYYNSISDKYFFKGYIHKRAKIPNFNANSPAIAGIDINLTQKMLNPLASLLNPDTFSITDPQKMKEQMKQTIMDLFNSWLDKLNQDSAFSYKISLAASYVRNDNLIDFTIQDQCRYRIYKTKDITLFSYVGGLIEPLFKNTVAKDSPQVYPIGIGISYDNWNISYSTGITFDNLLNRPKDLVSVGYEVSLTDIEF
ncbi:hypothetical protein ACFL4D_02710 [Candidatus Margulisiibacteriota bacterium]